MTDLTPKQIEDALTNEEYKDYKHFVRADLQWTNQQGKKTIAHLKSLAEARIENKRLRGGIRFIELLIGNKKPEDIQVNGINDGKYWAGQLQSAIKMAKALLESEAKDE